MDKVIVFPARDVKVKLTSSMGIDVTGEWDLMRTVPVEQAVKHVSLRQRFVDGVPWEDTPLFKGPYALRFGLGGEVRGCSSMKELLEQYYSAVDGLYESMKKSGFKNDVPYEFLPVVHVGRNGELIASNNGNHRLAIAQILDMPKFYARVGIVHGFAPAKLPYKVSKAFKMHNVDLPAGADQIPAMTTFKERELYYKLAKQSAANGAIVELGTWLGAATVFIAAGIRDSGTAQKVHGYDRFLWQPIHQIKAGFGLSERTMLEQFQKNMGELLPYVVPHAGEFESMKWNGGPISYLALDGPKRVKQLSYVFRTFGKDLIDGGKMSIQDFAYFPAYDIPVVCEIMERENMIKFDESVFPGTTFSFTKVRPWHGLKLPQPNDLNWSPREIENVWTKWASRMAMDARPRFMVGAVMFMYDMRRIDEACKLFKKCLDDDKDKAISQKFDYFRKHRKPYLEKYKRLFDILLGI